MAVSTTQNDKTRLLFIDSRSNTLFGRELGANLDYAALKREFELSGKNDKLIAVYVLQQKDNVSDENYEKYVAFMKHGLKWEVDQCIEGMQASNNYSVQIESMQLALRVLDTLEVEGARIGRNGNEVDVEVVICANHSSYLTLFNMIRKSHEYAKITLVHTSDADELLVASADKAINILDLDVARDF